MTEHAKSENRGSDPPEVRLRGASLAYRGQVIFENLDLDLASGRITCLLGPSGVGKSSLLRTIAGLGNDQPDTRSDGRLTIGGTEQRNGRIAYLAQQDLLLPWLNLLDNVTLGSRLRGSHPDLARARDLIARVGLSGYEQKRPAQLSGGMRQRAALARTLMEDRPLVLMDEPFSALDAITRFELQELACRLLQGKTVLLVTHDPLEALRIGHRLLILAGSPARLEAPLDPPGTPLRDLRQPQITELQAAVMQRLMRARDARLNGRRETAA